MEAPTHGRFSGAVSQADSVAEAETPRTRSSCRDVDFPILDLTGILVPHLPWGRLLWEAFQGGALKCDNLKGFPVYKKEGAGAQASTLSLQISIHQPLGPLKFRVTVAG